MTWLILLMFQGEFNRPKSKHHQIIEGPQGSEAFEDYKTSSQAKGCVWLCCQFSKERVHYIAGLFTFSCKLIIYTFMNVVIWRKKYI